jgi:hypothetical protein
MSQEREGLDPDQIKEALGADEIFPLSELNLRRPLLAALVEKTAKEMASQDWPGWPKPEEVSEEVLEQVDRGV